MMIDSETKNSCRVDETKVKRILRKIIIAENNNLRTGEKSDNEMVKVIRKMIEEEAECY